MTVDIGRAYESRLPILELVSRKLEERLHDALGDTPHIDRIGFRAKSAESFIDKARSVDDEGKHRYVAPLEEVEDQIAGRILVFFRDDLSVVEERLRSELSNWVEVERKRPENVSEFGYESDHYIFVIDEHMKPEGWGDFGPMPTTFELQIRTLFMHAFAEPQHNIGYKGGPLDDDVRRQFAWIAASAWGADTTLNELQRSFRREDSEPADPEG